MIYLLPMRSQSLQKTLQSTSNCQHHQTNGINYLVFSGIEVEVGAFHVSLLE